MPTGYHPRRIVWVVLLFAMAIVPCAMAMLQTQDHPQEAFQQSVSQDLDRAISDLSKTYRLQPGESIRMLEPPFSAERAAVIRLNYGVSEDQSKQIACVIFAWRGDKLVPGAWTYHAPTLEFLLQAIDTTWIDRESLASVKWA